MRWWRRSRRGLGGKHQRLKRAVSDAMTMGAMVRRASPMAPAIRPYSTAAGLLSIVTKREMNFN